MITRNHRWVICLPYGFLAISIQTLSHTMNKLRRSILLLRAKYSNTVVHITCQVFCNTSSSYSIVSLVSFAFLLPHAERPDTFHYFKSAWYNPLEVGKPELAFLSALYHIFPTLLTLVFYRKAFPPDSWVACIGVFQIKEHHRMSSQHFGREETH